MPINSFLYPGAKVTSGYEVANSLRFDGASSAYLNKTFGSSGNRKTFTLSFWIKKCVSKDHGQSDGMMILGGQQDSYPGFVCFFNRTTDTFVFRDAQASNNVKFDVRTDAKFRDFSAWTHIVVAMDTTQETASNRIKVYINGTETTDLNGTSSSGGATDDPLYPDQNFDSQFNSNEAHFINKYGSNYEDMYLAEYCFIDGQQLTPTSFGEFDEDTGIWKPIDVSGLTFGTNGFYLDFENSGSLGADVSGNGNNFTVNNLTSIDQSTDTCTNNYATLNGLNLLNGTLSNGNTTIVTTNADSFGASSTIGVSQGKWYVECKPTSNGSAGVIGIASDPSEDNRNNKFPGISGSSLGVGYYAANAEKFVNGTGSSYGNTWTTNDIMGIALDLDNNYIYFSKNGTWQNSGDPESGSSGTGGITITAASSTTTGFYFFVMADGQSGAGTTLNVNFGSPPYSISSGNSDGNGYGNFEYSVPSGYYALNSKNLAEYG